MGGKDNKMKYFQEYPIQEKVKENFSKSIRTHHLAHAYLFHGSEGCGKEAFALELAKAVNCEHDSIRPCYTCLSCQKISRLNHPDIKLIFPTAKNWSEKDIRNCLNLKAQNIYAKIDLSGHTVIQIERIRELKNEAKLSPCEAKKKVYIISEAEKMTREGANAFLKLLEEPPDSLLIILITSSPKALLDTIRSRCQPLHFSNLNDDQVRNIVSKYLPLDDRLESIIHVAEGNLKSIFSMVKENFEEKRELLLKYLRAVATGDMLNLAEAVEVMTREKDKNYLKDILNLLILWFKDIIYLKNLGLDTRIINIYFINELKKFRQKYGASNLEVIVNEIENAITNINRNIYAPLVLTTLAIRIKRNLIKS
jgi:DNA polymerase-3 subunit delta'